MATTCRAPRPTCTPPSERTSHDFGHSKILQWTEGLRLHPAGRRQKDVFVHATALERAGIMHLSEGQKVTFDTANDPRSGKIAVSTIELA